MKSFKNVKDNGITKFISFGVFFIVAFFLGTYFFNSSFFNKKFLLFGRQEGFTPANTNYGQSSPYSLAQNVDTSNWGTPYLESTAGVPWGMPNMTVIPGQPLNRDVKQFLGRESQPVPLPDDELLIFATTPFKPECCPSSYSNGSGCACITSKQYNYLIERGGNNVPYSEY